MISGLPEKLQEMRRQYGFTQQQVANRLGVSPSVVSGYETGERTPSAEVLLALAYLYNCSTDYLLGRQSQEPHATLDVEGLTAEQLCALRKLIDSMKK